MKKADRKKRRWRMWVIVGRLSDSAKDEAYNTGVLYVADTRDGARACVDPEERQRIVRCDVLEYLSTPPSRGRP